MGQNMGQLISKFGGNLWDIDIKNLAVSLIKQTGCIDHVSISKFRSPKLPSKLGTLRPFTPNLCWQWLEASHMAPMGAVVHAKSRK